MQAKKQKISILIVGDLKDKIAFGQSKYQAKKEAGLTFGQSTYKIYSEQSYNTYKKECLKFADWLNEEKGIKKVRSLDEVKPYAKEYIEDRIENGYSAWTVKTGRSALGMLYGETIQIDKMPVRTPKDIKRSRGETKNDTYHSRDGKYKDLFTVCLATGGRRKDINKLTPSCFTEIDGKLYVNFFKSKGGRNRLTPVLDKYQDDVKRIVDEARMNGEKKMFPRIPKEIDVHGLRREYCQGLYDEIKDNKELRDKILENYPPRRELKTYKDKDGNSYTKEIKSDVYKDRDGNVWKRDDIYVLSQALGHNRLDVSVTHYLKNN